MALFTLYGCCVAVILWANVSLYCFVLFSTLTHFVPAYPAVKWRADINWGISPPAAIISMSA